MHSPTLVLYFSFRQMQAMSVELQGAKLNFAAQSEAHSNAHNSEIENRMGKHA